MRFTKIPLCFLVVFFLVLSFLSCPFDQQMPGVGGDGDWGEEKAVQSAGLTLSLPCPWELALNNPSCYCPSPMRVPKALLASPLLNSGSPTSLLFFWLCWFFVAARGLSLVAVTGGYSLLWFTGFSLWWLLLLQSMGSRYAGFSSCGAQAQ